MVDETVLKAVEQQSTKFSNYFPDKYFTEN